MESSQHLSSSRLIAAREYRGLTQKELADKIGVTPMAVSAYEKGAYQPTKDRGIVQQISFALRFPIGWFYDSDIHLLHSTTPTFRSRRHMTAALRGQATRSCDIAVSVIAPALRRRFKTPAVALPNLSRETPEVAAAYLRDEWKLGQGPINNMVHLLEAKGVMVFWTNIEDNSVDACSFWLNEQPVILLNSHKRAGDRSRFDAAHELAHLLVHREGILERSVTQRRTAQLSLGDSQTNPLLDGRAIEKEADTFASSFLVPHDQWRRESPLQPILTAFFPLKRRWKVSVSALVRRSRDVGLLSQDQYERAIKEIGYRGWRVQEPDEVAVPAETSLLHQKIFAALKAKGKSPRDLAQSLNLGLDILGTLMPFAEYGIADPTPDNVLSFEGHIKSKSG